MKWLLDTEGATPQILTVSAMLVAQAFLVLLPMVRLAGSRAIQGRLALGALLRQVFELGSGLAAACATSGLDGIGHGTYLGVTLVGILEA